MRTETVVLPAFLASALINGDTSGLSPEDLPWLEKAKEFCAPGSVVDVGESYCSRYCDLPGYVLGADMAEYTVLYAEVRS